jgi:hypothetical protein
MTGQNVNLHGFLRRAADRHYHRRAIIGKPHVIVNQINAYEKEKLI